MGAEGKCRIFWSTVRSLFPQAIPLFIFLSTRRLGFAKEEPQEEGERGLCRCGSGEFGDKLPWLLSGSFLPAPCLGDCEVTKHSVISSALLCLPTLPLQMPLISVSFCHPPFPKTPQ